MKKQQNITLGAIGLSLFLISTGLSFAGFRFFSGSDTPTMADPTNARDQSHFVIDPDAPKTEECPLNGKMHTKGEKDIWETRRPLAVMIENHVDARPQSGLSSADIVYEAVAEGGITRFMGMFHCGSAVPVTLAPVRSARYYFMHWALEYDALYNHVGGAGCDESVDPRAHALCKIREWGLKDMDQFGISFPTCYRNKERLGREIADEHTMVCFSDKLYELAQERGWTNVDEDGVAWDEYFKKWEFKDNPDSADRGGTAEIEYVAWDGYEADFGVRWEYDSETNMYKRFMAGEVHADLENDQQIEASAVVVQFADEEGPVDDHLHLLYENVGEGEAMIFQDGEAIEGSWEKDTRSDRTMFYDEDGKEITFTRGQIWISMLPTGADVSY